MKKIIAFLIVAIMIVALVACGGNTPAGTEKATEKATENATENTATPATESEEGSEVGTDAESADDTANVGVPNPIEDAEDAGEFGELGITLDAPTGAENVKYSIIDGKIAHVDFLYNGHAYTLRASMTEEDIAGIYGETVSEKSLPGGATLTEIADGGNTLFKVEWSRNGTNYSLTNSEGATAVDVSSTYEDSRG